MTYSLLLVRAATPMPSEHPSHPSFDYELALIISDIMTEAPRDLCTVESQVSDLMSIQTKFTLSQTLW